MNIESIKTKTIKIVGDIRAVHKRYVKIIDKNYPELIGNEYVEFYKASPRITGSWAVGVVIGKDKSGEDIIELL